MPSYRPTTPQGLVDLCADRLAQLPGIVIAGFDGADAADPAALAGTVAGVLRAAGRAADVVRVENFIRPASQRLEYGAHDEMTYRTTWFDYAAIRREVIDAARLYGRWLPRLWNAKTDRSFRDSPRAATDQQILLIAGPMLARAELELDLLVRVRMSRATLERRTPPDHQWTISPLLDYEATAADPDIEVRYDHPDRPAVSMRM